MHQQPVVASWVVDNIARGYSTCGSRGVFTLERHMNMLAVFEENMHILYGIRYSSFGNLSICPFHGLDFI
jgi:hypothetical protein